MEKEEFLKAIAQTNPQLNQSLIGRAFEYAQKIYQNQTRLSGQTLLDHCAEIALALTEINLGSSVVVAGLLHEAIERVNIKREELKKEFGEEITFLVEGATNIGKVEHKGAERNIENLRKLFLATAKDVRVAIIKLVNRLHGLKTIYVFDQEKQKRLAKETLEIYAPIAYRLSMRKISGELEDIAFPLVYPEDFKWLMNQIKDRYQEREKYLNKLVPIIKKELAKGGVIPVEIHWRAKRYYSLFKKLQRYEMDLNKIYDLVALRIIVKDIDDCYSALGIIHKLWRPLPGRIKDYIALPKPNGYRSLHTTVFCPDGKITEFQIRTLQMHQESEYGIAAHWYYSEKKGFKDYIKRFFTKAPEKEIKLVQQLQKWQQETSPESDDFLQSIKINLFNDRIFVFTPQGDIIDLPEGATAIDFAYHVHTSIGHRCVGAKADGKIVSLDQPLENNQVVEVITQKQEKPSKDWLRFAKTNIAKNKIRAWFKKSESQAETTKTDQLKQILKTATQIVTRKKIPAPLPTVEVKGETKILTNMAKCCNPKPFDQIIGYITLNRGISVHRTDCPNLKKIKDTNRFVAVSWKK